MCIFHEHKYFNYTERVVVIGPTFKHIECKMTLFILILKYPVFIYFLLAQLFCDTEHPSVI